MEQGQDPSPVLCTPSAARITSLPWLSKMEGPGGSRPSSAVLLLDELRGRIRRFPWQKAAHTPTGEVFGNYYFKN